MSDIFDKFIAFMGEHDAMPAHPDDIIADGVMRYCDAAGDKPRSLKIRYYLNIYDDKYAKGGFVRYNRADLWIPFKDEGKHKISKAELSAYRERSRLDEVVREEALEKLRQEVADEVAIKLPTLPPASPFHPYIVNKEVRVIEGVKQDGDELIIPMMKGGKVWSYERIKPDGGKFYLKDGLTGGCYFPMIDPNDDMSTIIVGEGYSTCVSIRDAVGFPVFCAFNAGNIGPATKSLMAEYPNCRIILAADNDARRADGNLGIKTCTQVAAKIGGAHVVYPEFNDFDLDCGHKDFNDLMSVYGLDAVRAAFAKLPEYALTEFAPPIDVDVTISKPIYNENWKLGCIWKNQQHEILDGTSLHNTILFIENHDLFRGCFVYDEFCDDVMVLRALPWMQDPTKFEARRLMNEDIIRTSAELEQLGIKMGTDKVRDAIEVAARKHRMNAPREYLSGLEWDGRGRLDTWLIDICAATEQPPEYLKAIGPCFFIAGVARTFVPGSPFHHMLVLEGGQGKYKSTMLKTLATFGRDKPVAYFADDLSFAKINDPNIAQFIQGKVIIEFAELSGLDKKQYEAVKQWITLTEDRIMKKYEKVLTYYPRQFLLAGSTNEHQWLRDPTGNRRFWPVKVCGNIDIARAERDREQLWAEAVHRYRAGEAWYIKDDDPVYETVQAEQAMRMMDDIWGESIEDHVRGQTCVRVSDIMEKCLFIPRAQLDNSKKARVKGVLMSLGYEYKAVWHEGRSQRLWVKNNGVK